MTVSGDEVATARERFLALAGELNSEGVDDEAIVAGIRQAETKLDELGYGAEADR